MVCVSQRGEMHTIRRLHTTNASVHILMTPSPHPHGVSGWAPLNRLIVFSDTPEQGFNQVRADQQSPLHRPPHPVLKPALLVNPQFFFICIRLDTEVLHLPNPDEDWSNLGYIRSAIFCVLCLSYV